MKRHPIHRFRRTALGLSMLLTTIAGCNGGSETSAPVSQGIGPTAGPASVVETPAPTKPEQPKLNIQ